MLWRARGETTSGKNNSGENGQGNDTNRGVVEIRLDVSSDRMDLLHRAQHFLQEALMAPEKLNDPALRAQVGEVKHRSFEQLLSNLECCACGNDLTPTAPNSIPFCKQGLPQHAITPALFARFRRRHQQLSAKKQEVTAKKPSLCTQALFPTPRCRQGLPTSFSARRCYWPTSADLMRLAEKNT